MSGKTIIFLVLFSISAITAEIEHAKKYYASREYEKAYRIFRELAEQGNPEAQLYVAIFLYKKIVSDPSMPSVIDLLTNASSKKYPQAMAILALFYLEQNRHDEGIKLMEEAALLNSGLAQYYSGYFDLGYYGKKRNKKHALEWLKKAVANPDHVAKAPAAQLLGVLYYMEGQTSEDLKLAVHYFQIASDANDPDASLVLFELFFHGEAGIQKDIEKAKKYFRRALEKGNTEALALAFFIAVKKRDFKKAYGYFEQVRRKKIDIPAAIKRYDHIIKDHDFEKILN